MIKCGQPLERLTLHIIVSHELDDLLLSLAAISVDERPKKTCKCKIGSHRKTHVTCASLISLTEKSCLLIKRAFSFLGCFERLDNGKSRDSRHTSSRSSCIHCGLRRKTRRYLCNNPVKERSSAIRRCNDTSGKGEIREVLHAYRD